MTARATVGLVAAVAIMALPGCGPRAEDGPPQVLLGESPCDQCGMIISDERFAAATIIEGPRGPEPRLFDDYNCQMNFEKDHPDSAVIARWAHDYPSSAWIRSEASTYLKSPKLRTPMASHTAAFRRASEAEALQRELGGEVLNFARSWPAAKPAPAAPADH